MGFTNVVLNGTPFHCTVHPETKLLPVTLNVKDALPAVTTLGFKPLIVGAVMAKVKGFELGPNGGEFPMTTEAAAGLARVAAGIKAVRVVELT